MRVVDAAQAYAARGWSVFPLHRMLEAPGPADGDSVLVCSCGRRCSSPGKHPRTPNGVKDASADAEVVRAWWRAWPDSNVGIATGTTSDLYVVDVESEGLEAWMAGHAWNGDLGEPLMARTGGGGLHLYYRLPVDVFDDAVSLPNTHWRLGRHIDTRGTGGYVAAPPSNHRSGDGYSWLNPSTGEPVDIVERNPPHLPAWLHDALTPRLATPPAQPTFRYESTPYGEGVLRRALEEVSRAAEGTRNSTLNTAAFRVGQFVGGGEIDPRGVAEALLVACPDPDRDKSEDTIRRALFDGAQYPRRKDDRNA